MHTPSRRTFLVASTAALASTAFVSAQQKPGDVLPTQGPTSKNPLPINSPTGKYRPPVRLGLGGVAIGNGFAPNSDEDAQATLKAAYDSGATFFDTSPFYGHGLSERRFGHFLHTLPRDSFTLSTKVGRIFKAGAPKNPGLWKNPSPFSYTYDYSADGTRRSIEDSLQRLGLSSIDIVFIHDLSPDTKDLNYEESFQQAAKGAMPALTKMREEGLIKAWGLGVNTPQPALRTLEIADADIHLLACQYSLLDHTEAVEKTFPALHAKNISVVVGSPILAGYLAGRDRYLYDDTVPAWAPEKRAKVQALCTQHNIDLRTAALQFANAHPAVSAIIPGARNPAQTQANAASMKVQIPQEFWSALKSQNLIHKDAPTPA